MPSAIEHIFEGQISSRTGQAGGYHYDGIEGSAGRIISGTESPANEFGAYQAEVEVNGVRKIANDGKSTFFPRSMSPQEVIDAINEAYDNCSFVEGSRNTYRGYANNGMLIEMYLNQNGKIISAYPKIEE